MKFHPTGNLQVLALVTQVADDADCIVASTATACNSDSVAVLAEYAGMIHDQADEIVASLVRDGHRYAANLPRTSFEPVDRWSLGRPSSGHGCFVRAGLLVNLSDRPLTPRISNGAMPNLSNLQTADSNQMFVEGGSFL